jgi:signal transduction histidine kinase
MLRRKFPATSESTLKNVSYNSSDLEDLPIIVSEIEHSCCSAIEILNELLMYDRIEDGKLTLDRECTNAYKTLQTILRSFDIQVLLLTYYLLLFDICYNMCVILCHQALSSGIKYIYGGSLNPPQLQDTILIVDINKFNQVIRNLISNALKFSPVGGTVEVTSFFVESEEMVADEFMTAEMRKYPGSSLQTLRIEVSDEGPGISMVSSYYQYQFISSYMYNLCLGKSKEAFQRHHTIRCC